MSDTPDNPRPITPTPPVPYRNEQVPNSAYTPAWGATSQSGNGGEPPRENFGSSNNQNPPKRKGIGVIAALAIGAIVGGASGAGIALATSDNESTSSQSTSIDRGTINVNDPDDATTVTAVAAKATPSVVTIAVSTNSEGGTGSGVVLTADGYILTNTHVVTLDGASADGSVDVTFSDGRILDAEIVGTDPVSDLAVIKVEATGLTPIEFADSSQLNVGDTAIAIGAPLGLSGTVTDGIVSALNRSITIASSAVPEDQSSEQGGGEDSTDPFDIWGFDLPGEDESSAQSTATTSISVIQTDAAINPGNSGGALLNSEGQLIGVNVAIASAGSTSESATGSIGVGFAIPSNLAKRVTDEIMENGSATHGLLGASIVNDTQATSGDKEIVGAVIADVVSGGAADKAGLKADDVITSFNGLPVTNYTDLIAQVRSLAAGATAPLTYVRDGDAKEADVTLDALE
jgi:putative serine protease PepD